MSQFERRRNLMTACGAALIGYDYLLTIERESRYFWKRKMGAPSLLFFANRYLALFYYVGLGMAYYRCQSFPLSQVVGIATIHGSHTVYILESGRNHAQERHSVLYYLSRTDCARQTSFLHSSLLNASYVTKLSEPITTVLISRFMLDLHQSNLEAAHQDDLSGTNQFMGSLGIRSQRPSSRVARAEPGVLRRQASSGETEEWSTSSIPSSDIELNEW
ncbi:hypothetical protein GSI_15481 [Ganoderma sinense ZZ0214-1]|uniref:DUF6533 domain-containing protein n=1 Tax=Ganoderma sinense ZZ0214-1 TaxID=1077348 RepID=A0A2G8RMP9_9APHY|nr:hypothetical protein GSI_15481 [Ganoderma sinense ZZ0214-1]